MEEYIPKVLLTSNDIVGASAYAILLQNQGMEVISAFGGGELLDILDRENYKFDVIITDVRVPGLKGYDIGDYVTLKSGEMIPIVGMADLPRDEEILLNASESFSVILEKGFSAEELIEAVESIVYEHDEHAEVLTKEEIQDRAQSLVDTNTVPMKKLEFNDFVRSQQKNIGHRNLLDHFKKEE